MPALEHRKVYEPPTMGLNTRFLPASISDEQAAVLQNAQVNNAGILEKDFGFTVDGVPFSGASFIRTIFEFRRGTSIDDLLIAASDPANANATYKVDIKYTIGDGNYNYIGHTIGTATFVGSNSSVTGQNTSWTHELKPGDKIKAQADADTAYTEILTVNSDTSLTLVSGYLGSSHATAAYIARKILNTNNIPRFCTFNNVVTIWNGSDIPQQWDGTSENALINTYSGTVITIQPNPAPVGFAAVTHKNRLFTYSGSTIYWSHTNDQTFWDPASFATVFSEDGGDIIAILSFSDSLFCFKNNGKIYRVFGDFADSAPGTVSYITSVDYSEKIGIIADRSPFVHGGGGVGNPFSTSSLGAYILFLAETGVYKINAWGTVERISYFIEPLTKTFNFSVGATTQKSFPFTTLPQWNTGTNNGTYPVQAGSLYSYFDDFRQTDAQIGKNLCAIAVDSNNTIHVAYIPYGISNQINYVKYYNVGTVPSAGSNPQKETSVIPAPFSSRITCLAIAVDNSTGKVGIVYSHLIGSGNPLPSGQLLFIERSADSGTVLGTWGSPAATWTNQEIFTSCAAQYTGGGVPCVAATFNDLSAVHTGIVYSQRNTGVWATNDFDVVMPIGSYNDNKCSLQLDGSANIYIVAEHISNTQIEAYKSTNGGTSFSLLDAFTASHPIATGCSLQGMLDHNGNFYSTFSDTNGNTIRRNHTLTTSFTVDSSGQDIALGSLIISRTVSAVTTDYFYYLIYKNTAQQEDYLFETSSSLTNPNTNTINTSTADPFIGGASRIKPCDNSLVNNGQVIATVQFGTNSKELVIRRVAFYGFWTGPEQHDSTLSAWGTFVVTNPQTNGNTLTYQIALSSAPGATNFVNINNGAIISSNSSLIYNVPKLIFSLAAWSGISLQSLVLNYTGAGVDARQAFGISFYDEAYYAVSQSGQTANNMLLIYDIKNSPRTTTHSVNCMERFKTLLYAGSATDGSLYVLKNGFDFGGSAYTMDVQLKEDFLDAPELTKDFYKAYVYYKVQASGTFTFSYRIDSFKSATGSNWTDIVVDQTQYQDGVFDVPLGQSSGKSIQFRVQNANADQMVQIYKIILYYGFKDLR